MRSFAFVLAMLCKPYTAAWSEGVKLDRAKMSRKAGSLLPVAQKLNTNRRNILAHKQLKRKADKDSSRTQDVHAYAREYARVQRLYNGARPEETLELNFEGKTKGQVPYWDVDRKAYGSEVLGVEAGSPFVTEKGKFRVFSHYLNFAEHEKIKKEWGKPKGWIEAEMTSSYRSLLLYPEDDTPYMLKFSGKEFHYVKGAKELTSDEVRRSVENSLHLRKSPIITPEPAGLIVKDLNVNAIYRPLPQPKTRRFKKGDRLITWQVFMSEDFRNTKEGKELFLQHGGYDTWLEKQAAPAFAKMIMRSMFTDFVHLELHSQNIDAILDKEGNVVELQVKDLLDIMQDPVARTIMNTDKRSHVARRSPIWGDVDESGQFKFLNETWIVYSRYLSQSRSGSTVNFGGLVHGEMLRLVEGKESYVSPHAQENFDRFVDTNKLEAALHCLRKASLQEALVGKFSPDENLKSHFKNKESIWSIEKTESDYFRYDSPEFRYGTVNGVPAAVVFESGHIVNAYFAFDQ